MVDDDKRLSERITRVEPANERKKAAAAPPTAAPDPYLGKTLSGRYRILHKLGQGGMGAVYLAEHIHIEKRVAIKILSNQKNRELLTRFAQEAKAASKIGHENIIDITDFGETDEGQAFIAMESLDGRDLGYTLRTNGPLGIAAACAVMYQVCRALGAAHEKGIVHRDLKPDNIFLIERDGRRDFVKILDFGLARVTTVEAGSRLTKSGTILGTPEYMAPEQVRGDPVDGRADVYAAGCMLYELLTGDIPFSGGNYMVVLQKHLQSAPEPPSKLAPNIPAELDAVVLRAMAKDPARRFQTMKEMALALCAAVGDDPQKVWSESAPHRETPTVMTPSAEILPVRKSAARAVWSAAAVVVVSGAIWWSLRAPAVGPVPIVLSQPQPVASPSAEMVPVATSHVAILTEPADADVLKNGASIGRTPLSLDLLPSTEPFDIIVTRRGFKDLPLHVEPAHSREYTLRLVALPVAHKTQKKVEPKAQDAAQKGSPELKNIFE